MATLTNSNRTRITRSLDVQCSSIPLNRRSPSPPSGNRHKPRAAAAFLVGMLPLDRQRREEAIVLGAFHAAALTGQGIAAEETLTAPRELTALISGQLQRVTNRDAVAPSMDPDLDAELILAAVAGLAQGMLPGYATAELAAQLVERLLDRILGPTRPQATNEPEVGRR
ncbi:MULTISPECIES: TetR family transcriptional regulator C-terminal domain-containing protein [unclassified Rhodococcus (in: high G+C Gram-positive bacteria)]|uniref:TetR family transcriptional regulator C-terminal domain-containing protein n=1 Tax=unclassified Rhodococcus (in: high G+C Gram-positive bacteria) TaxID=192944 RepID=UPI00215CFCD8|nr:MULTISPECIES: TetR family transcriptional regulator C-terminal domain-containing protein [unclassified Rhodococcus (in: high G+C Gram-positive bacteria)]